MCSRNDSSGESPPLTLSTSLYLLFFVFGASDLSVMEGLKYRISIITAPRRCNLAVRILAFQAKHSGSNPDTCTPSLIQRFIILIQSKGFL